MPWNRRLLHSFALPLTILILGLSLTAASAWWKFQDTQADTEAEFQRSAERTANEIVRRFQQPVYGLNGAKGLYAASKSVQRAEFRAYVQARDLPKEFPGVRGFGFIQRVDRAQLQSFVATEQADEAPQFAIRQLADTRHDDLLVIKLIEPADNNKGAQGLDVGSEPVRRAGAQTAIDTGEPAITGAITLVQDNKKTPGVLLFVPIYAKGSQPATVQERRASLVGLLYSPIVIAELLDGIGDVRSGLLDFEVYDAPPPAASGAPLMYDADNHVAGLAAGRERSAGRSYSLKTSLALPGRQLTLEMHSTHAFDAINKSNVHWMVLGGGALLTLLLTLLLHQQSHGRRRAEALAQKMTQELDRMAQVAKHTSNAVSIADRDGRIIWINDGFTRITGYTAAETLGKTPAELLSSGKADPDTLKKLAHSAATFSPCRVEILNRAKDGHEFWIDTEIQPQRDSHGNYTGFMEIGTDITERRQSTARLEAALRDNDALLSTLNLHAIVSIADRSGCIMEVNDAFCDISGYTREELVGANHRIVNSGVQPPEFWVDMWKTIATGMPWRGHVCNRGKDGHLYWVDTFVAPFIGDDGQIDKYISIRTDITANKQAESQLLAQRQALDNIIEGTNVGTWEWDVQTGATRFNARWAQIVGYSLEELSPLSIDTWSRLTHPKDLARSTELLQQHFSGALASYECEARMRHKDGHWVWVLDRGKVITRSPEGLPLTMAGTHMDISERHAIEAEAKRSASLLRGSIEAIDEAFVLYDPEDRLVLCNNKYREVYSEVAHLMVPGARFEDIIRAGAEQGQYVAAVGRVDAWVAERVAIHRAGNSTLVQRLANGRSLRIIERILPDGHIVGFRIDITELVQATEAAQAASQSKSQFLANMSHEIRTPMNAILGMLTLLRKTELTPRQADYAAKSDGAARSLLGLINDILDFSKIEAGKMVLDPHPFDVDQLLRDLSVILSASLGVKPVELLFDIDPALPRHLVGDAMRMQQVLINLGSNAIKFTARGEVVLSIKVLRHSDVAVTFQVSMRDSGIGIAPENQARIFSGFTQAESSTTRRFGGTGLGVAISQRFVELMGGELELQSAVGEGSRFFFTLTLPLAPVPVEATAQAHTHPKHTLVIDDNPTAREVLQRMCESLGWVVDVAESGEQALELLQAKAERGTAYEAVFIDWQMPGLDGWQTSQRIRELKLASEAPVVVMVTAHGREMLSQRSAADQALLDGFLVKPVTASMLQQAVLEGAGHHAQSPTHAALPLAAVKRLQGLRLLVVEDNLNNQQVARELLEDEGAVVQLACDGQEGVAAVAAASPPFDVVLMDLQMPVMDGFAASRHIRDVLKLTTLPIVAMTANAMTSDREACLAAGMNDHVGKPFDLNHLVQVLRKQAGWNADIAPPDAAQLSLHQAVHDSALSARIDIQAALTRLGGKQEVYMRMLRTFVHDLALMPAQLQQSAAQPDPVGASRILHTLKGLAATLGATDLAVAAAQGERTMMRDPGADDAVHTAHDMCAAIGVALPGLTTLLHALEAAQEAHPDAQTEASGTLDRAAASALLGTLVQLLANSDMQAMQTMAELQQQFGHGLGDPFRPLEDAMAEMDFELALPRARALAAQLEG